MPIFCFKNYLLSIIFILSVLRQAFKKSPGETAMEQPDEKQPVEGQSTEPHSVSPP